MKILILTSDSNTMTHLNYGLGYAIEELYSNISEDMEVAVFNHRDYYTSLQIIQNERFDILHTHDVFFIEEDVINMQNMFNALSSRQFIWIHSFHGDLNSPKFRRVFPFHIDTNIFTINNSDLLIFHSDFLKSHFYNKYKGLDYIADYKIENAAVINSSYSEEFYPKEVNKDEIMRKYIGDTWDDYKNKYLVCFSGRDVLQKGIHKFTDMAVENKWISDNMFAIWIGSFNSNIVIKENMGIDLLVLPKLNRADVNDLYNCCDIFWNPSEIDPFGISTIEAMKSRKPLIIGDEQCGVLCQENMNEKYKNTQDLSNLFQTYLSKTKDEKETIYKRYDEICDKYKWEDSRSKLISIYKNIKPNQIDSIRIIDEESINEFSYGKSNIDSNTIENKESFDSIDSIIRMMHIRENDTVLEIAGSDRIKKLINRYTNNYTTFNLSDKIELKVKHLNKPVSVNNLLKSTMYEKQYDITLCFEVLEHTAYSMIYFANICDITKKDILISFPNKLYIPTHFSPEIEPQSFKYIAKQHDYILMDIRETVIDCAGQYSTNYIMWFRHKDTK